MNDFFNKYPSSVLIGLCLIIGSYLVFCAIAFSTPYFSPAVLIPPMGFGMWIVMNSYGEIFAAIRPNLNLYLADGTHCTVISGPDVAGAGKIRYIVAVKYRMCPPKKRFFFSNMEGMTTLLTGEVNMPIEAPREWFWQVPEDKKNPVEGAIFAFCDINGKMVGIPNDFMLANMAEYNNNQKIIYANTIEKLKSVLSYLSKESNKDSISQSQVIYSVISDLTQALNLK